MLLLAVVVDVSDSQEIKRALAQLLRGRNEYLRVHVAHPDNKSIPRSTGESFAMVAGYRDGHGAGTPQLLRQLSAVAGSFLEDCDRHFLVITDRLDARTASQLTALASLVSDPYRPAKATLISMGRSPEPSAVSRLPSLVAHRHIDKANDLSDFFEEL